MPSSGARNLDLVGVETVLFGLDLLELGRGGDRGELFLLFRPVRVEILGFRHCLFELFDLSARAAFELALQVMSRLVLERSLDADESGTVDGSRERDGLTGGDFRAALFDHAVVAGPFPFYEKLAFDRILRELVHGERELHLLACLVADRRRGVLRIVLQKHKLEVARLHRSGRNGGFFLGFHLDRGLGFRCGFGRYNDDFLLHHVRFRDDDTGRDHDHAAVSVAVGTVAGQQRIEEFGTDDHRAARRGRGRWRRRNRASRGTPAGDNDSAAEMAFTGDRTSGTAAGLSRHCAARTTAGLTGHCCSAAGASSASACATAASLREKPCCRNDQSRENECCVVFLHSRGSFLLSVCLSYCRWRPGSRQAFCPPDPWGASDARIVSNQSNNVSLIRNIVSYE